MSNILCVDKNHLKCVLLDRPEALNSLNGEMVDSLLAVLSAARGDAGIKTFFFKGAGGKAFCAGGDIKAARLGAIAIKEGRMSLESVVSFFVDEYELNKELFHYAKPTISFMNGITMGGGVGIAGACRYRITTEKTVWAMPEVTIGFFPDVGAAHYLSRAPHHVGRYLAMTGAHIANPADLIKCGLATHFMPLEKEQPLVEALAASGAGTEEIIAGFAVAPGDTSLPYDKIESCFGADNAEAILENLAQDGGAWALETEALIRSKSPTSVKVALRHVMLAENEDFDTIIARDLKLAGHFLMGHDLIEGVRAAVVDKDRSPKWNPPTLERVGKEQIEAFFNQNLGLVD